MQEPSERFAPNKVLFFVISSKHQTTALTENPLASLVYGIVLGGIFKSAGKASFQVFDSFFCIFDISHQDLY